MKNLDEQQKNLFKKDQQKNVEIELLQDAFIDDCQEVSKVYQSFLNLRMSFDQALKAFKFGNSTEALLKYSMALNLYKKVNNYDIAGIICNNMGNIHLKLDRVDMAISCYSEAIELGHKSPITKNRSKITRKMNKVVALREKFYQQL
jgi:tetratricopeptide (TPR) repeat protein